MIVCPSGLRGGIANPMRVSRASSNLVTIVLFYGDMPEWFKGTDLKSVGLRPRRFEPDYHRFGLVAELG